MLPKPRRSVWEASQVFVGSLHLKIYRCPAKNNKQKLAGNAAKTPKYVTKISVFTQKFPAKKYEV